MAPPVGPVPDPHDIDKRAERPPMTASWKALRATAAAAVMACIASSANPAGAADRFCGLEGGTPDALATRVKAMPGIREVHRDKEYLAYQEPATSMVLTFTEPAHPAHPAAVCRKPIQKGDTLEIEMAIVCQGAERHCTQLEGDFKLLNAKMQADINNRIQSGKN